MAVLSGVFVLLSSYLIVIFIVGDPVCTMTGSGVLFLSCTPLIDAVVTSVAFGTTRITGVSRRKRISTGSTIRRVSNVHFRAFTDTPSLER